jgi:DUF1680 family protein
MRKLILLGIVVGVSAGLAVTARPAGAADAVQLFDLADVRLGPGPFRAAMDLDRAYLLFLDPDRLLQTFRVNAGLPTEAQPYGGWEAPQYNLRGHTLGHYLSACSLMYRSTGDAEFKQRIDRIVAALADCQAAAKKAGFHEGYLSAFPESFIDRVEARKEVFPEIWAPWYTLHKIMAGLLDANQLADNAQALEVLQKMAGWVAYRVDHLTHEQMQASLETEQGGMVEVLANLSAVTGNPEYLRLARAFEHAKVLDPLAAGEDQLDGLHANTQIPKIIGAAREFELTGEARYQTIAETFWASVALHRSYVTGGHSDREHFFPVTDFRQHVGSESTETCSTYNMLKLTRHLYAWQPEVRFMDFYERALYNHILASQDPARGMFAYFLSLEPGHFKTYSTAEDSFWCCVGTGMENHAKYGDTIFARDAGSLYVNLFIPAELTWRDRGVKVRQETQFPASDTTRLTISTGRPVGFKLKIRHPGWAAGPLLISINGQPQADASQPGTYAELNRTWADGDRVEVRLPLALHTETLPGADDLVALMYGPIVLAGKLGTDGMPLPYAVDQLDQARRPHPEAPVFVTDTKDWLDKVELLSAPALLFRSHGLAQPHEVPFAPLYQLNNERYAVYWRVMSTAAWQQAQATAAAAAKEWAEAEKSALDYVVAGDAVSEAAHVYQGDKSDAGVIGGRAWRGARRGGNFSYELDAHHASQPLTLLCVFDSRDKPRRYHLVVNGTVVPAPTLDNEAASSVAIRRFEVPVAAQTGSSPGKVTIKFQADDDWDSATGNVFALALVAARPAAP